MRVLTSSKHTSRVYSSIYMHTRRLTGRGSWSHGQGRAGISRRLLPSCRQRYHDNMETFAKNRSYSNRSFRESRRGFKRLVVFLTFLFLRLALPRLGVNVSVDMPPSKKSSSGKPQATNLHHFFGPRPGEEAVPHEDTPVLVEENWVQVRHISLATSLRHHHHLMSRVFLRHGDLSGLPLGVFFSAKSATNGGCSRPPSP